MRVSHFVLAAACLGPSIPQAQIFQGDIAPMFISVDENMRHIDMLDLIDGRPLVSRN